MDEAWPAVIRNLLEPGASAAILACLAPANGRRYRCRDEPPALRPKLTVVQVADALGVSVGTLQRMVKAGQFPPAPLRDRQPYRWPASAVLAWMEAL